MASVRKLEIRIDQTGDAKAGVQQLSKGFGGLGSIAGPAGIAITAAAAGITVLGKKAFDVGSQLIEMGSDAEEMTSKFNVVFGESAPTATKALEEFGDKVGRSTFELMEMASGIQDTFVPLGFARDEASGMSIELSKLAVDMGSFNNVADADVMRDLQSAIVGNHETMRKYGVVITQATLDQELLRMGVEGGTKAASEQEKVQARLNLIMAGTTDAQGDAERTAGSWANQMRALKATLSEAATTIGSELLPFVTPLLHTVVEIATKALPPMLDAFKEIAGHLREQFGPVIKELIGALKETFDALGITTGDTDLLRLAIDALKIGITLAATVLKGIAETIRNVAKAIKAMRDAVDSVISKWNEMKRAVKDAVNAIPSWLRPGSPTPFEIGLRGIGDALGKIDIGSSFGSLPAAGSSMPGGGGVTVYLNYAPAVSLGNRYEAEKVLAPYITEELRRKGLL